MPPTQVVDSLLVRFGVDPVQWRALVRVALKNDLRSPGRAFDVSGRAHGTNAMVGTLLMLVLMGGAAGMFLATAGDLFLGASLYLLLLAFVIASSLLIEYQSVVLSPADHRQLSFQPVTSRTFLAARLTSVLVYVLAMALAFCIVPTAVIMFLGRGGPLAAAAGLAAAAVQVVVVTLVVIGGYVAVLTVVPATQLVRALSYVQLVFSFLVYGSYMIVPKLLGSQMMHGADLPRNAWSLLNPSSWFAGWVMLASGERTPYMGLAAGLSLAALAASALVVGGRLSIDYAERLGAMITTPAAASGTGRRRTLGSAWLFANAEARAVAVLVRAQFRYDNRFRLTVLSILPLTLVYMFSGVNEGGLNPFSGSRQGQSLVYMAIVMFPPMLRASLTQTDAHAAAWVFHGTPADLRALVLALKNYVAMAFLLPYLAFIGLLYVAATRRPAMVAVHMVLLGLVSHLLLVLDFVLHPDPPFSQPPARASRTRSTLISIVAAIAVGTTLPLVLGPVYASPAATGLTLAGLAVLNALAHLGLRARLGAIA